MKEVYHPYGLYYVEVSLIDLLRPVLNQLIFQHYSISIGMNMRTTSVRFNSILLASAFCAISFSTWTQGSGSGSAQPSSSELPAPEVIEAPSVPEIVEAPTAPEIVTAPEIIEAPAAPKSNPDVSENRQDMTFDRLTAIIGKYTGAVNSENGGLTFSFNEVPMTLLADERANRMRIITPIVEADQLAPEQMLAISLANFHLALDARYALGGNMLYSTYIHPLRELTAGQVESAIRQVSTLRLTFGTTYSSGEMSFGGSRGPQEQDI